MALAALRLRSLLMVLVLVLHALVAVRMLRWLPQGFPMEQLLFWSNLVVPGLVVGACIVALALLRSRPRLAAALLWGLAGAWGAGGAVASVFFPKSLTLAWVGGVAVAGMLGALAWPDWRRAWGRVGGLLLLGAVLGTVAVLAQRAPRSSTRPANVELPRVDSGWAGGAPSWTSPTERLRVSPTEGRVWAECGGLKLRLDPLLTFISRSPDRAWSNLAPARTNEVPRQLSALRWTSQNVEMVYRDDGTSVLQVVDTGEVLHIDAFTLLRQSVFSHLNTYLALEIEGQPQLAVEFSAVPGKPVELRPAEYPTGLPARAAYLTAENMLRVVEASSGEKGPFQLLMEGKLEGPLTVTLHDAKGPACQIELADWAAQVSTAPSPTAGWGLPQNAIEFQRMGKDATSPGRISFTLAGTSLGRGWNTVGHGPGAYANKVVLRPLREEEEKAEEAPHPPH